MGTEGNDMEIVAALQAGEPRALERLIKRYAPRVYRVALEMTRNHADAEEVMQDVFLTVVRKIKTFEGRAAFGTWIYRVATNLALTRRRRTRPSVREPHAMEWADQRPTPEEYALAQERQAITARLLDGLPVSYQRVVLLRDIEGLSTTEAAEFLGASIGCVKSRLHRARALLRQQLLLSPIASRTLEVR